MDDSETSSGRTLTLLGRHVPRVGLGTMQFTGPVAMGPPRDQRACIAVLRQAVGEGVRVVDTAGYYGPGHANETLAAALHPYPEDLVIATKVGAARTSDGAFVAATRPGELRQAVQENLRGLRVDRLDLVHVRRMPDSTVPFAESVAAVAELQQEGLVNHLGVSNVDLDAFESAQAVARISSVQNELSAAHPGDQAVLDAAGAQGIPVLAFRPLGNGSLVRDQSPLRPIAEQLGLDPATLALAHLLHRAPHLLVIPGTSNPAHLPALLASAAVGLDSATIARIDAAFTARGAA